jgi:hypothetical protein
VTARTRAAVAGAGAATVWGLLEPLDQHVFGCEYSDVRLVGFGDRRLGFVVHAVNGAVFGVAFDAARRRANVDQRRLALALAVGEHVTLWPLLTFIDRDVARSPRAFLQGTARHALFGWLLGRFA